MIKLTSRHILNIEMKATCPELLPFLKVVDVKTKEHTKVSQFSKQGTEFMKSVADAMDNDAELMTMFYTTALGKIPETMSFPYKQLNGIFRVGL